MSRYLNKISTRDMEISQEAKNIIADSTLSFYKDGEDYYYSDIHNASSCPIANLMYIGTIEDVEDMLMSED